MKEGAASGPLFLYSEIPKGGRGCTIGISGPDLPSAAFRAGADIVRSESGGGGMLFRASPSAYLDENPKRKIHL